MTTLSKIPVTYDIEYLMNKIVKHLDSGVEGDEYIIRYRAEDFDAVQEVLDSYPVSYAEDVLKAKMAQEASAERWKRQQLASFMGGPLPADDVTISGITAAIVLMDVDPDSPKTRRWKAGPGVDDWITIDRNTLVAMGSAIGNHVQNCFDREEELQIAIAAADDIDDLAEIDISDGWPGQ